MAYTAAEFSNQDLYKVYSGIEEIVNGGGGSATAANQVLEINALDSILAKLTADPSTATLQATQIGKLDNVLTRQDTLNYQVDLMRQFLNPRINDVTVHSLSNASMAGIITDFNTVASLNDYKRLCFSNFFFNSTSGKYEAFIIYTTATF